ncbi:MAG: hypothetical protein D6806_17930 [Deltaproteobacteria bacterium]|nr:MAG: hypothetical protein D6806_17930 [Deltaproteobacteria bacterium]
MTALETLKALVDLQQIDLRIRELEKDRQQIPARLKEIDDMLGQKRQELKEEQNQLDEAELARRVAESDLKAEKEKIKKWEARLSEIRNNRDYQALSREIEAARKANLGIEDEILRKMQEIEDLKTSIEQKKQELDQLEQELGKEKAELEQKLASLSQSIEEENRIRQKAVEKVDQRWYRQYETIKSRRDGIAVVDVVDEHCQGCHMGIPPQLYNLVLRGEEIETCPFCQRIFYYKPAIEQLEQADAGQETA